MKPLYGKIAVVTGASRSTGIGTAICLSLADAGADIFFTHWTPFDKVEGNGAEEYWPKILKKRLEKLGVRVGHMQIDLEDKKSPSKLLDMIEDKFGTPSILINNATYESPSNFHSLNADILDRHYKVNNRGTIMLSLEFARRFEKRFPEGKNGRIINLVSGGPDPNNLAYIATKGLLTSITEPLAVALAPIGITVNCVNPGPTDSGWMNDHIKKHLLPLFPTGRIGMPEDAAKIIKFLASEESGWITGQLIRSDGGFIGR